MQTTYYSVMKEVQPAHWVELVPRPRSKSAALKMGADVAESGLQVRVDRHVERHERVKTFNKPERRPFIK